MMLQNISLVSFDALAVHLVKELDRLLDVGNQIVTATLGEVLPHDNPEHLHTIRVRGHGVGRYNPSPGPQLMGQREFVILAVLVLGETESNERKTLTSGLAHDDEATLAKALGQVVGNSCQVGHDGVITLLSQADQLIILTNNLRCTLGEVECEGSLVGAEVVDVEDEFLREVLGRTPQNPTNTRIDKAVLLGKLVSLPWIQMG